MICVGHRSEISSHNERLTRINDKAEHLDIKILTNVERLKRVRLYTSSSPARLLRIG